MNTTATGTSDYVVASAARVDGYPPALKLDRLGIAASLACAIHCLVAPVLLLLLPAAGSIWSHPSVHWILAALVLPLALIVVFRGYRHHRRRSAVVAAVFGAAFIVAGLLIPIADIESSAAMFPLDDTPHVAQPQLPMASAVETCTDACSAPQSPSTRRPARRVSVCLPQAS